MGLRSQIAQWFAHGDSRETPELGERGIADALGADLFAPGHSIKIFNPSDLVSRRGMGIFDEMRRDEQVKAAMAFKKGTVVANGWEIVSPEGRDDDWEVTEFVKETLGSIGKYTNTADRGRGGLDDKIVEMLTSMEYGFSATEKIWEREENRIVLRDLKTRAPHNIDFEIDRHGNIEGLFQLDEPLPQHKFIIHTYDSEFQNPYGRSDLEQAYRHWWIKYNAMHWLAMLLEKHGIPPIFALYNQSSLSRDQQKDLQTVLKNIQSATVGMIPRGDKENLEMWSPNLSDNVQDVFLPAIDKFDNAISKAILMPGLLGFTSDESTGSLARSQTHFDVFMLVEERLRSEMETVVNNEIIAELVHFNFGDVELPHFQFKPLTQGVSSEVMQRWTELVDGEIVHPQSEDERHIRDQMGFPTMNEDTQERWERDPPEPGGGPDQEPGGDDGDMPEEMGFALSREKTQYEQKVDFQQIEVNLNQIEAEAIGRLADKMKNVRSKVLSFIENNFEASPAWVRKVDLRGMGEFQEMVYEALKSNFEFGREQIRKELPGQFAEAGPSFLPSEAISFLKSKSLDVSRITSQRLINEIHQILLQGIKTGKGQREMMTEIEQAFRPYIGDPSTLKNGEPLSRHMMEVIIRTNSTEAFNQGRLIEMRSDAARETVEAVQYSAIIDSRTTDVCRGLDGKIFRPGSDDLTSLTPPNHHSCRSVLTPITVDEPINEEDIIDARQIGRAKEQAGKGFV